MAHWNFDKVKVCKNCGVPKNREKDFYKSSSKRRSKDGRLSWCKTCMSIHSRDRYAWIKEHDLETYQRIRERNRIHQLRYRRKSAARLKSSL